MTLATNRQEQLNGSRESERTLQTPEDINLDSLTFELDITVRDVRDVFMHILKSSPSLLKDTLANKKARWIILGYNLFKMASAGGVAWLVTRDLKTTTVAASVAVAGSHSAWALTASVAGDVVARFKPERGQNEQQSIELD